MISDQMEKPSHRITATVTYTNMVGFFVDDFTSATNNPYLSHITYFSGSILHGVHSIFPPPNVTKHQGQDPISQRKN